MTVVSVLTFAMLGGGVLLALVRLALGPSLLDRVVATDALLVIISAGLAVYAALTRNPTVVPVLVVVSLLGFVGSVSVARYIGGMLMASADDGQDVGLPPAAEQTAGQAGGPPGAGTTAGGEPR
ncbi:monovalent cation/H+ antiporter complex subunit F [Modestobacter sp. URMC 112]